ncbi:hypothetical protein FISHEDRAFT_56241 [Fistulina hepatica ATCC 64428]|uniref:Uncharacterized protein n=1 Tax=Fistulina hepatica ATCC 64428 TaxID=1128425 RepID=A0A0D7AMJ1_9AGAR|nr:hypothetical protein FISHEDRAFT_56241 [Fistulina hepatica ATCC 64428]
MPTTSQTSIDDTPGSDSVLAPDNQSSLPSYALIGIAVCGVLSALIVVAAVVAHRYTQRTTFPNTWSEKTKGEALPSSHPQPRRDRRASSSHNNIFAVWRSLLTLPSAIRSTFGTLTRQNDKQRHDLEAYACKNDTRKTVSYGASKNIEEQQPECEAVPCIPNIVITDEYSMIITDAAESIMYDEDDAPYENDGWNKGGGNAETFYQYRLREIEAMTRELNRAKRSNSRGSLISVLESQLEILRWDCEEVRRGTLEIQ